MQFQIDFPNPDNQLYPGMYGEVQLPVKTRSSTLTIPASAMVFNAAGAQVVIIKDNKAHYQKISIGRDFGTELEVVSGVAEDDQIDVNPDERITENSEVELRNSKDNASNSQAPVKVAAKD